MNFKNRDKVYQQWKLYRSVVFRDRADRPAPMNCIRLEFSVWNTARDFSDAMVKMANMANMERTHLHYSGNVSSISHNFIDCPRNLSIVQGWYEKHKQHWGHAVRFGKTVRRLHAIFTHFLHKLQQSLGTMSVKCLRALCRQNTCNTIAKLHTFDWVLFYSFFERIEAVYL